MPAPRSFCARAGWSRFRRKRFTGWGGDARNDMAVAGIFEAKGRPRFNPLIVHVDSPETARRYVEWPDTADRAGQRVLARTADFGAAAARRCGPVAAGDGRPADTGDPGARASRGRERCCTHSAGPWPGHRPIRRDGISPTTAAHVAAGLDGRIAAILDGGASEVGVESTILGLADGPALLRPGGLPVEAIEAALGGPVARRGANDPLTAPGQMTSHYAPGGTSAAGGRRGPRRRGSAGVRRGGVRSEPVTGGRSARGGGQPVSPPACPGCDRSQGASPYRRSRKPGWALRSMTACAARRPRATDPKIAKACASAVRSRGIRGDAPRISRNIPNRRKPRH